MIWGGLLGFLARRHTRAATGPVTTSRATSRRNTVRPNASSNWAAGARLSTATFPSEDGWLASVVVRTWEGFALDAPCRDFRINSCHSWMSRRVEKSQPALREFTAGLFQRCAPSLRPL